MKFIKEKVPKIILYIIAFAVAFTFLVIISELVFIKRNGSKYLYPYYLDLTKTFAQKESVGISLFFLGRAAEIKLSDVTNQYPSLNLSKNIDVPRLPNDSILKQHYVIILQNIKYEDLAQGYASRFAKIFYLFGLTAYNDHEPGLIIPFWKISIQLAPEWSFFHLELANYYLLSGQANNSYNQLEYCLSFKYPREACLYYLQNNWQTGTPEKIGTWENQIEDIK